MTPSHEYFANTAGGLEDLLADELRLLGGDAIGTHRLGVSFSGPIEVGYRACLWTRVASSVLLRLSTFPMDSADDLYRGVQRIPWERHFGPEKSFAVRAVGRHPAMTHTGFAALRTKDAIADRFREIAGVRPSVDTRAPHVRIHLHLAEHEASVSLNLAGESLHRRGYRGAATTAPLKENLAAAMLLRAGWANAAKTGSLVVDPMCGSGTILIEAAWMAADVAPGLYRQRFGFEHWSGHDPAMWERLRQEARLRILQEVLSRPLAFGFDNDPGAVRIARDNAARAGVDRAVRVAVRDLAECRPPVSDGARKQGSAGIEAFFGAGSDADLVCPGLVVTNPPYGARLGEESSLRPLYETLGDVLRRHFPGWRAFVLTGNRVLAGHLGLKPRRRFVLYNGDIECRLLELPISTQPVEHDQGPSWRAGPSRTKSAPASRTPPRTNGAETPVYSPGIEMLANRLRKNLKRLRSWAESEGVSCYRVYDADLPEYALAIDLYEDSAVVQEYAPPPSVDPRKAENRLEEAVSALPTLLSIHPAQLFVRVRQRQRGHRQYQRMDHTGAVRIVSEGGYRFEVNLSDYLDTGLFLDQRRVRALIGKEAVRRSFLNLFAYTGSATVYAAGGGARSTVSIDLSRTYLDWMRRNLEHNRITGPQHQVLRADCLEWLPRQRQRYGLIFISPPTFSASKKMTGSFDVQRDHLALLNAAARLLEPDGLMIFSTHRQRFRLDEAGLIGLAAEEITKQTMPLDFARRPRFHRCWRITHRSLSDAGIR